MKVHAPKTKLTPRERRHSKQVATLTRWHKKRESAIKTLAKSERIIPRLEKALQRYDRLMANAPLAETKTEPEAPTPQVETVDERLDIPEFLRRDNAAAEPAAEPPPKAQWVFPAKPKRKPRAKPGSTAAGLRHEPPSSRKPKRGDPLADMLDG